MSFKDIRKYQNMHCYFEVLQIYTIVVLSPLVAKFVDLSIELLVEGAEALVDEVELWFVWDIKGPSKTSKAIMVAIVVN